MSARCLGDAGGDNGKCNAKRPIGAIERGHLSPGRDRPRHRSTTSGRGQNSSNPTARDPRWRSNNHSQVTFRMERRGNKIIESSVEARQGFLGRPVLVVLVISCVLAATALALSFAGVFWLPEHGSACGDARTISVLRTRKLFGVRGYCTDVTRQTVFPTSSAISKAPVLSTATPTGRPRASPFAFRNPVTTSSALPFGWPPVNGTNTTL